MKLTIFSIARTKDNQAKLITDSESTKITKGTIKINRKSSWTLFLIVLTSAVIYKDFSMKTRLRNIFKIIKTIILTNTIIENP